MTRIIATFDTESALVVECGKDGTKSREFCRRGNEVWEVLADGTRLPAHVELKPSGDQLLIQCGETLEVAIRHTLEPAKPRLVERIAKRFWIFG